MTDEFINLKDSEGSDAIFGIVTYVVPLIISVKYKHNGMSYTIEIPRTETNAYIEEGDEIEMQLFIMKERDDER